MINLTNPIPVQTILGSASKTNYDRFEITSINYDIINQSIAGSCRLICSTVPAATVLMGNFNIVGNTLNINIANIGFFAVVSLLTAQLNVVLGWINGAQNTLEVGVINLGVVQGVQSAGV